MRNQLCFSATHPPTQVRHVYMHRHSHIYCNFDLLFNCTTTTTTTATTTSLLYCSIALLLHALLQLDVLYHGVC
jgi:hypothetical protein